MCLGAAASDFSRPAILRVNFSFRAVKLVMMSLWAACPSADAQTLVGAAHPSRLLQRTPYSAETAFPSLYSVIV